MIILEEKLTELQLQKFLSEIDYMFQKYYQTSKDFFHQFCDFTRHFQKIIISGGFSLVFDNSNGLKCTMTRSFLNEEKFSEQISYVEEINFLSCVLGSSLYDASKQNLILDFEYLIHKEFVFSILKAYDLWKVSFVLNTL